MGAKQKAKAAGSVSAPKGVVGTTVLARLDSVKPNSWNPNRMTPGMTESLREGLRKDGWLASQALLIWATDDGDNERYIIIDGEHRWKEATGLGMVEGPMVFLNGLSEKEAKALTIKLNQKRGEFDSTSLQQLLEELVTIDTLDNAGVEFGFSAGEVERLLGPTFTDSALGVVGGAPEPLPRVAPEMMGTLPKLRVPLTFYVQNDKLEELLALFRNPNRPTELQTDLLFEMIEVWQASKAQ